MAWKWTENGSSEKPAAIDDQSSAASVFVRRNFILIPEKVDNEDPEMSVPAHWKYQEEIVPREQWPAYYSALENAANIDYIAMEVGVDL